MRPLEASQGDIIMAREEEEEDRRPGGGGLGGGEKETEKEEVLLPYELSEVVNGLDGVVRVVAVVVAAVAWCSCVCSAVFPSSSPVAGDGDEAEGVCS